MERFGSWWALERTYSWSARKERFIEWLAIKIAWAMPRRLAMWAYYRVAAHATQGRWGNEAPDSVSIMTAADRWDRV